MTRRNKMDSRKLVLHETAIIAAGIIVCTAVMFGVYALLGYFTRKVLLGGIAGSILSILNFFFMAIGACQASDVASGQDVRRGKLIMKSSYATRLLVVFVILFALITSGLCEIVPSVLPLVFIQPVVFVTNFFRK